MQPKLWPLLLKCIKAFLNKRHQHASDEFHRNRDRQEAWSSRSSGIFGAGQGYGEGWWWHNHSDPACQISQTHKHHNNPFWHWRTCCKEIWRSQCHLLWGFATSPPYIEHSCCAIWRYSLKLSKENVWTSAEHGAGYSATVILHPWNEEASNPE